MYKTGIIVTAFLMLLLVSSAQSQEQFESSSYANSVIQTISPNSVIIEDCDFETDNSWLEVKDTYTSPKMTLPSLRKGQSNTLFLTFEEEYSMYDDFGAIYAETANGRYLLDLRKGESDTKQYAIDVTSFAGKEVSFVFENTAKNKDAVWKVKKQNILQDLELEGEINSINSKYIRERDHQFVYLELTISGDCPKIDEFSELNFDIKEEDKTKLGVWHTQDIYMFATPDEPSNIAALDIVFVVDASISLRQSISDIETQIKKFLEDLEDTNIDHRAAFVVFADDVKTLENGDFISNPYQIQKVASTISEYSAMLDEGDTDEENQFGAINVATGLEFRPEAKKAIIMITDEASLENNPDTKPASQTMAQCQENLRTVGIAFYPVFDIYDATQRNQYIPLTSDEENVNCSGKFYHIDTNFDLIMEDMKNEITNTYKIVYKIDNTDQTDTKRNVKVKVSYDSVIK